MSDAMTDKDLSAAESCLAAWVAYSGADVGRCFSREMAEKHVPALLAEVKRLRAALAAVTGPLCDTCGNRVDLDGPAWTGRLEF